MQPSMCLLFLLLQMYIPSNFHRHILVFGVSCRLIHHQNAMFHYIQPTLVLRVTSAYKTISPMQCRFIILRYVRDFQSTNYFSFFLLFRFLSLFLKTGFSMSSCIPVGRTTTDRTVVSSQISPKAVKTHARARIEVTPPPFKVSISPKTKRLQRQVGSHQNKTAMNSRAPGGTLGGNGVGL